MYRQVLGNQYAMASERLKRPKSLFKRGVELQHFVEGGMKPTWLLRFCTR